MTAATHIDLRRTARLAGFLYLAMMPFGFFGIAWAPSSVAVPGDAAATAARVIESEWLLRAGVVSHAITQVIFVFLVLTLFRLLESVNRRHAVAMAVLALVSVPMGLLSEINMLAALGVLNSTDGVFTPAQQYAQAMGFLEMRWQGILITQVFWGLWLLPLALLVFNSGFLPRLIGVLLAVAGAGYVFDSAAQLLSPGFMTVSLFTFVGEVLFTLWLLVKGVSIPRQPGSSGGTNAAA